MTYTPISSQTLTSAAASVTFSSIPGTFRDLILSISAGTDGNAASLEITQINGAGITGLAISMSMDSSSTKSSNSGNLRMFPVDSIMSNTAFGQFHPMTLNFKDYSETDKHKTVIAKGGSTISDNHTGAVAIRLATLSAITSINLTAPGASFAAGSRFSLFGVAA